MKVVLREDESGVSEVVGTILILAMTVVLFSTIIIWVSSIPTPVAQTRVDIQSSLIPQYDGGLEAGDWINLTHVGGESLPAGETVLYITDQKGSAPPSTGVVHLATFRTVSGTTKYGLLDGPGTAWSVGQRFSYYNTSYRVQDTISVTIVDLTRSLVVWSATLNPPTGTRPPVFVNVWASQSSSGTPITPVTGKGFFILAQISSPDNPVATVTATVTYWYGRAGAPNCAKPMYDDGSPAHGDASANDGIFSMYDNACTGYAYSGMDGSLVLLNATDIKGHTTTTRMILHVLPGTTTQGNGTGYGGSGRPPNLRWNGNQGYNIFNATQWDTYGYAATPSRTFKGGETVVLVVGSLSLQNVFGVNQFHLLDPFSGNPAQDVVYGVSKTVGPASLPSTTSAFSFFQFVNGYYIYTYRFKLNDAATVGTNFYTTPPQYPRYYYFANYPLSVLLTDSANDRFTTTDSINITSNTGTLRTFPSIQTFSDPYFIHPASQFSSTAIVYVQVNMLTVNLNNTGETGGQVLFGNILIQDFAGGQELNRAPTNGIYSNLPICPPVGSCGSSVIAIWSDGGSTSYRFAINLARVNQDPWVAGLQNYALTISSIRDFDESYASVSGQIVVQAPLYKMDILTGNTEGTNSAWGTKDYAYFYQDYNGFDLWKKLRVDYCYAGTSISGVAGSGSTCPSSNNVQVAFGDFWHDGTLGAAESFEAKSGYAVEIYRRAVDATGAVVYLPVYHDTPAVACDAITTGDLTGDGLPEVICGGTNGWIWYYANNGNWSTVFVHQPTTGSQINSISVGDFNGDGWNDIAVGGAGGYLKYYPNLGYGRFQNTGIDDNWFAVAETTATGNITSGTYLSTYAQDGSYESLREALLNIPLQTGGSTNPGMDTSASGWTFASAYNATGASQSTGGNPNSYVQITTPSAAGQTVAGYWYQSFTVSGSPTFTVNLSLNYDLTAYGATSGVTFYAFVDTTNGAPPLVPSNCVSSGSGPCWTSGAITTVRGWTPLANFAITGRVPSPGTYYLKVAMYASYAGGAGSQSVGGFDNVQLAWTSQAGATSALTQYWRMAPLPTRLGTSFTFKVYGHETGYNAAPDYDNFTFAYSTNVVGADPTTGTYTTMFTVNAGSDANYQFALPSTVAGQTVWVRVLDTNRIVGDTNLDNLYVDYMTINANTPAGTTGVTLTNPGDTSAINSIDAQDQNFDFYADLVVGTANGNVFKYMGSAGGLTLAGAGAWYFDGGFSIVGVRFGNFTAASGSLQIALAFGTTVRIIRGSIANTVVLSSLPVFTPSSTITAFGVGDINGDGWDDVAIGTNGGGVFIWENLGGGTTWTYAVQVDNTGVPIYSLVLGASTNSQYVGR